MKSDVRKFSAVLVALVFVLFASISPVMRGPVNAIIPDNGWESAVRKNAEEAFGFGVQHGKKGAKAKDLAEKKRISEKARRYI